ncbi:uncharacterized protein LOC127838931 [Dreissena polymorpha]|uniref:uncharacterized protein LOC127838931 n=1 Tax=Dreissena polymorpha TaxID=45954 RepID=UPI002264B8B2|nr:uncharacterized protein LOC127838931 [Dreissena polymorpha]
MSAQAEELQEVELTDNKGKTVKLSCSKQIIHLLFSLDTDSNVKEMVVQGLLGQVTKSCSQTTVETSSDNVSKWSSEAEMLVLEKFFSLENRTSGTRHKWEVVAEKINKF